MTNRQKNLPLQLLEPEAFFPIRVAQIVGDHVVPEFQ